MKALSRDYMIATKIRGQWRHTAVTSLSNLTCCFYVGKSPSDSVHHVLICITKTTYYTVLITVVQAFFGCIIRLWCGVKDHANHCFHGTSAMYPPQPTKLNSKARPVVETFRGEKVNGISHVCPVHNRHPIYLRGIKRKYDWTSQ